jgi:hypothetical protein
MRRHAEAKSIASVIRPWAAAALAALFLLFAADDASASVVYTPQAPLPTNGEFAASSLAIDQSTGELYVASAGGTSEFAAILNGGEFQRFDASGNELSCPIKTALSHPANVAVNPNNGVIYIGNWNYQEDTTMHVFAPQCGAEAAGSPFTAKGGGAGSGTRESLLQPATDSAGNLYWVSTTASVGSFEIYEPDGTVIPAPVPPVNSNVASIAVDSAGNIYMAEPREMEPNGYPRPNGTTNGTSEVQEVNLNGATGGTFRLCKDVAKTECTGNLAFGVSNFTIAEALEELYGSLYSTEGPLNFGVSGSEPRMVTFQGGLATETVPQMTCDGALLTGGSPVAACSAAITTAAVEASGGAIKKYTSGGSFLKTLASGYVTTVAVDQATGEVFVGRGKGLGFRIEKYSPGGALLATFGKGLFTSQSVGFVYNQIAVNETTGTVYATDAGQFHGPGSFTHVQRFSAPPKSPLTVTEAGPSTGTIECDLGAGPEPSCLSEYDEGTVVTLVAAPVGSHGAIAWEGCDAEPSATECEVEINGATNVTANWVFIPHELTVVPLGLGSVSDEAGGAISGCEEGGGVCSGPYGETETVVLTADPDPFQKVEWGTGDCEANPTPNECEFEMPEADKEVEATFSLATPHKLTVIPTGPGAVSENPDNGGISGCEAAAGTCEEEFGEGQTATLTATPQPHKKVTWTSGCTRSSGNTCEVDIGASDATVHADFINETRTLTVTTTGSGNVSAETGAISGCETTPAEGTCSGTYDEASLVKLTATPKTHQMFKEWSGPDKGGCTTALTCEVTIPNGNGAVTAIFEPITRTLTVTVAGSGSVSAAASPAPVSGSISACTSAGGSNCTATYKETDVVPVTDTPGANFKFEGWSGADKGSCTTALTCNVTIPEHDAAVTATNGAITRTLTVTVAGSGSVSAAASPAPISGSISGCTSAGGSSCTAAYKQADVVALTATPGAHFKFEGWSGADKGSCTTAPACNVTIPAHNAAITATATQITHTLTVNKAGTGAGSVTCDGGACASTYNEGASVTLAGSPTSGSTFAGFSGGGCSGTGGCTVTIEADTAVTATFNANPTCVTDSSLCPPDDKYDKCVKSANTAYQKALKAAKKKHGKARVKAIKAAKKKKKAALASCKSRFLQARSSTDVSGLIGGLF